jgi:poly-gamma-glutamate capsule biosynthesis protein CapA/YwtB (metallophosphatase superfamily)
MRIRRFRLERASVEEAGWLAEMLDRESRGFGVRVEKTADGRLALRWG